MARAIVAPNPLIDCKCGGVREWTTERYTDLDRDCGLEPGVWGCWLCPDCGSHTEQERCDDQGVPL